MSIGEAKRLHQQTRKPVLIADHFGRPVRSDLLDGIPYLLKQPRREPYTRLINAPGRRPYIAGKTAAQWFWRKYQPEPGEIAFTEAELAFAEPYRGSVMVEPHVKDIGHRNKDWGWLRWLALEEQMRERGIAPVIQCTKPGGSALPHARRVQTTSFRQTAAVLSVCRAYVGPEGGLHHAAAATGVPAVVIFGGFIAPDVTGYAQHRNLFTGGVACGQRTECKHCQEAMRRITPAMVINELMEILN